MRWTILTIVVLAVLVVGSVGYIFFDKYQELREEEQTSIYQQGINLGYQQAITQLYQQASTCQQVPIRVKNQTMNVIATECLQAQ